MGQPDSKLVDWLKFTLNLTEGGAITRFDLYHTVDGGEGTELLGRFPVRDASEFDMAQTLWDKAEGDAETRMTGRMQRYVALAYRGDEEQSESSHPFIMNGRARLELGGDTESATPSGHLAQLMRHDERMHGMIMQVTETTTGRLIRDLEAERARRIQLEDRQMKTYEMMEELTDKKHERDMEMRKIDASQQRHEQLMGMLMSMAPLVISKVLGPGAGVAIGAAAQLPAAGGRDESVHQFFKSLDEKEVMHIVSGLSTEKQIVAMEIFKAHMEEEERRNEPAPKQLRAVAGKKDKP